MVSDRAINTCGNASGDRQFWITRPYRWQSLLGAKVRFVLVFLNLPMTVADPAERSPSACAIGC